MTKQRRFSVKKMALKSTFGFATVNHNYTEEERQILNSYHSLEYLPPHSKVERERGRNSHEYSQFERKLSISDKYGNPSAS
jgi:hypothetical protein